MLQNKSSKWLEYLGDETKKPTATTRWLYHDPNSRKNNTAKEKKRLLSSPETVEVGHNTRTLAVVDDSALRHEADVIEQLECLLAGSCIVGRERGRLCLPFYGDGFIASPVIRGWVHCDPESFFVGRDAKQHTQAAHIEGRS